MGKQAGAITAMSAILAKTLTEFKTDLEAAKNADDALKSITVSEPTSVVVKLTDAARTSTDKTDKDKDKTTAVKTGTTPAKIKSTQISSIFEFTTQTAAQCAALKKSKSFNQNLADDSLTKAGLDPAKDKDKGACTTACGRRRLESTARSLATPTKTTSTAVVKGLTASQAKTLVAQASGQGATQVKALLDAAITTDTSL